MRAVLCSRWARGINEEPTMLAHRQIRSATVIGPLGEPLTRQSLPAPTERWTARRKAEVVAAINGGLLGVDEACDRYRMSVEELASWMRAEERVGMPGLRATRMQQYRDLWQSQSLN